MRIAYLLSSYLHFNALTSPSAQWIDAQLESHKIDPSTYNEWSTGRILLVFLYAIGIFIAEMRSHRFYISQTSEETKYPYKPHR